jgi:hypothetical protein
MSQFRLLYMVKMGGMMIENSDISSKNLQANQYLEEAFQTWTIDPNVEDQEYRKITSKKQIVQSQELINKAKALHPDDEWTVNRIKELQSVVDASGKEVFNGLKLIQMLGFVLGIVFCLIPAMAGWLTPDIPLEEVPELKQEWIQVQERGKEKTRLKIYAIENEKGIHADWSDEKKAAKIEKYQKSIDERLAKIEEIKNTDDKSFLRKVESRAFMFMIFRLVFGIMYVVSSILYKPAHTLPQFEVNRRELARGKRPKQTESEEDEGPGWFVETFFINQPTSFSTTYRRSDGTKYSETSANPIPFLAGGLLITTIGWWITMYIFIYPILVYIDFKKNKKIER